MLYTGAGEARIVRETDGHWSPVGDPLPPIEDDVLHDGDAHTRQVVYWHFHDSTDMVKGDRILCRERAWQLLDRCGPRHHAVRRLGDYIADKYGETWAADWMAHRQVWAVRPIGSHTSR